MIISIEASSSDFSLTLFHDENVIDYISVPFENKLSEIIVPTLKKFLKDNSINFKNISYLTVGCGPGSFTGIRSVISTALAIKISHKHIKSIGINSLAGLAMSSLNEAKRHNLKYIISSIDSKRGDLFVQLFKINDIKNNLLPFVVTDDINTIKSNNVSNYIVSKNLNLKDVLYIGHQSDIIKKMTENLHVSKNLKQYPDSLSLGKLALHLIKKNVYIKKTTFAFNDFKPIYARSPQINI